MDRWYASVNYGLENIIGQIICEMGAKDVHIMDSALVFSYGGEINCKCVKNLYYIVFEFISSSINEAVNKIIGLKFTPPHINGKTFRLVVMESGKLKPIAKKVMADIEKSISKQTRWTAHRANPDIEIWLNRRNDKATYFMVRMGKKPSSQKSLKKGELSPDIAYTMVNMANLDNKSLVADIFGGWGAISFAVAERGNYGKLYTGDIKDECVLYQQKRLQGKKGCKVSKWDACGLPLESGSISVIITDPPWGIYEKGIKEGLDIKQLYDGFVGEAARILMPNGVLIFLSHAHDEAIRALSSHGFTYSAALIKINGKDTFLFKAARQNADKNYI